MPTLYLALDNVTSLPDGGPTTFVVRGRRSVEIGRDHYLDWTLPDPERIVSGRHCEVRFADDGYWLTDLSTNGTFLNGGAHRIGEPQRLRTGDVIGIGNYLVRIRVEEDDAATGPSGTAPARADPPNPAALWDLPVSAAPPEAMDLRRPQASPVHPDALDVWVDIAPALRVSAHDEADAVPLPSGGWNAEQAPERDLLHDGSGEADAAGAAGAPSRSAPEVAAPCVEPPGAEAAPVGPKADTAAVWPAAEPPAAVDQQPMAEPAAEPIVGERSDAATLAEPPLARAVRPGGAMPRDPAEDAPFSATPGVLSLDGRGAAGATAASAEGAPHPAPDPRPSADDDEAYGRFLRRLGAELGLSPDLLADRSADELAAQIGRFMRHSVDGLHALLKARSASRGMLRRSAGTTVEAVDNNPLKFLPTSEDVLRVLLGPPTRGYLDLDRAMAETFRDISLHQIASFAAMQAAVKRIFDDLSPAAVEAAQPQETALGGFLKGGKGRLWDAYRERFAARSEPYDNGIVDLFILYFSDAYERAAARQPDERRN